MRAMQRWTTTLGIGALVSVGALHTGALADPCFGVADVGGVVDVRQQVALWRKNYRGVYDPVTGISHFFGLERVAGHPDILLTWWTWNGLVWEEQDTSVLPGTTNIGGFLDAELDPVSRVAVVVTYATENVISDVRTFNIDDPTIPVPGVPFSAARFPTKTVWVEDEGAFYFFVPLNQDVWRFVPTTGVAEQFYAPGGLLPFGLDWRGVETEYDMRNRRIVLLGTISSVVHTFFFDLDNPGFVEAAPSLPPPTGDTPYQMARNPATGDVLLVGIRHGFDDPEDAEGVWRLADDDSWEHIAQLNLHPGETEPYRLITPGISVDTAAGQIIFFGGRVNSMVNQAQPFAVTLAAPRFAAEPQSVVVPEGSPFSLMGIPSSGSFASEVRWHRNGAHVATTLLPFLSFDSATQDLAGEYSAEMVSPCGVTWSAPFHVTVVPGANSCPGDTSGDGVVNFLDLNSVLSNYGQTCD